MGRNIVRTKEEVKQIILDNVVENHEGCWLWQRSCFSSGYGQFAWGKKNWKTHRLVYHIFLGHEDDSVVVRHLCGNRRCCNPLHLASGTYEENSQDMIAHGRSYFHNIDQDGSNNIAANFTEDQVYEIRNLYKTGKYTLDEIAEKYSASRKSVERTVNGIAYSCYQKVPPFNWKDLDVLLFNNRFTNKGKDLVLKLIFEGKTDKEVAELTGLPYNHIKKARFRWAKNYD